MAGAQDFTSSRDPVQNVVGVGGACIGSMRPLAFIFTVVKPASTWAATASAIYAGSSPPTRLSTRNRSRYMSPSEVVTTDRVQIALDFDDQVA